MKKLLTGLIILGLTIQAFAQITELPEVTLRATNYKYLKSVDNLDVDAKVKFLEREVAKFDLTQSEYYSDEYDSYKVYFYIPDGQIVAAYDRDGNLLRTIEKYKDLKLPKKVLSSVYEQYPGWVLYKDVYKVSYHYQDGTKHVYKLRLEDGDQKVRVKTDKEGNFI